MSNESMSPVQSVVIQREITITDSYLRVGSSSYVQHSNYAMRSTYHRERGMFSDMARMGYSRRPRFT